MCDRGHDRNGAAAAKDLAAQTNQELGKDEHADRRVGAAERDQKAGSKHHDGNPGISSPLEIASVADEEADDGAKEGGGQGKGVEDVASVGDGLAMHDQEVGRKVNVPAKDGQEHEADEQAGADNRSLLQVAEWQELDGRKLGLPHHKHGQQQNPEHNQGNDVWSCPLLRRAGS